MNDKAKRELKEEFYKFVDAGLKIHELWTNNPEINETLEKKYPFNKDFAEVLNEVIEWHQEI